MSKFSDVLQAHEKQKLKKIAEETARAKQEAAEREELSSQFMSAAAVSAKPLFTEFAHEAWRHGFPSAVEDGHDQHGNPYLQVRFFPERYVLSNADTSRDCAFILIANLAERRIEAITRFHFAPELESTHKINFSKRTISKASLNKLLYGFLLDALEHYGRN